MINRLIYYKQEDKIEKGYIKNGFLFNEKGVRLPFKNIKPIIKQDFIENITIPYKIHPAIISKKNTKKHMNIKVGFIFSKNKKEILFGLKTDDSCIILNPIIISSSLLNEEYNISIFKNGKRDLSLKTEPQILKEIVLPFLSKINLTERIKDL
jgi:hypothetical protein